VVDVIKKVSVVASKASGYCMTEVTLQQTQVIMTATLAASGLLQAAGQKLQQLLQQWQATRKAMNKWLNVVTFQSQVGGFCWGWCDMRPHAQ
jgi:hypothetical protein